MRMNSEKAYSEKVDVSTAIEEKKEVAEEKGKMNRTIPSGGFSLSQV